VPPVTKKNFNPSWTMPNVANVGNWFLHLACFMAFYSAITSLVGGKLQRKDWVISARNGLWATSFLVFTCTGLLVFALVRGDFHLEYVFEYTNSTMPLFYKVAALWGGQNGSLLWWLTILSTYSTIAVYRYRNKNQNLFPYVITALSVIQFFFLILLIFPANPFSELAFGAFQDGRGLNPLLQNYYMIIHPPSLYLGYVGMSIPFAFGMAALISGKLDNEWILQIRKWTLMAWFFLSIGNLLGASWAYEVLGWGGYWAWDPVENAAFMPWLTASAFLHSVIIQEKRNMLKVWNIILVILSFMLTLTGTFMTRSGIVSSVHAFAQSDIGTYFFVFLIFCLVASVSLLIYRLPMLKSKSVFDSMISRESAFLFNNLMLVGAAFAILWGTLFPVLSEAVRGVKISIGAPYFNKIMIPIGLTLLLLTGIGPMIPWRKATAEQLKKNFIWPVGLSILTSIFIFAFVSHKPYVVAAFSFCVFVTCTIYFEYSRGVALRMKNMNETAGTALVRLVSKNERRYGGYIVHFGIVLLFLGFTGGAFKTEQEFQMKLKDVVQLGNYTFRYDAAKPFENPHKEVVTAQFSVWKDGQPFTYAGPARVFYKSQIQGEPAQPATEVAINRGIREDLYFALLSFEPSDQSIFVKIVINPLVEFIWIGGLFLIFGTVIVMWPKPERKKKA
jgi:cytochrome c-type biogenesis protein CcmF